MPLSPLFGALKSRNLALCLLVCDVFFGKILFRAFLDFDTMLFKNLF